MQYCNIYLIISGISWVTRPQWKSILVKLPINSNKQTVYTKNCFWLSKRKSEDIWRWFSKNHNFLRSLRSLEETFLFWGALRSFKKTWKSWYCFLFTALLNYKDENDSLQHESFAVAADYISHDKYATMVFLKRTSDKFKKLHPDIAVNKKYFRTDGAGQHFKHKYINCSTCLMKQETE